MCGAAGLRGRTAAEARAWGSGVGLARGDSEVGSRAELEGRAAANGTQFCCSAVARKVGVAASQ
ncbi:hypothetical protein GCM10008018_59880 [Paenibacillus marchantiophytorum]|uniref:Uncharacterized protein n=1 Tax=Paenibacillus marchantiophytorum TaxID=1619310 RepID=A0ABQ1FBH4_9BACL|nr:hypothetical protein GCM10008018_59880 [Paenibacillus marchantiophytorum]